MPKYLNKYYNRKIIGLNKNLNNDYYLLPFSEN